MHPFLPERKLKILIVYRCLDYPLRTTMDEHLYSFLRYSNSACYYIKLDRGNSRHKRDKPIPSYLIGIDFDIILFHYGFISARWAGADFFETGINQVMPLINHKAVKVLLTQDEYYNPAAMNYFINKFNIEAVFTLSPESECKKIFDEVDFDKVKFYRVLTGYLDDRGIRKINRLSKNLIKDIDIGYRARNLPQWLGRHSFLKSQIASIFNLAAKKFDLKTDISIRAEDTFLGDDWCKFLIRCKYMIGVEGGATVLDREGKIWSSGSAYVNEHPDASFEEVEKACFPGLDGKLELLVISPRHLESCATRTCQVLVESNFNGILKPWIHYIPVKKDFSNLDEVLQLIKDDKLRTQITENAYRDIVQSGKWSYRNFVNDVIEKSVNSISKEYLARKPRNTWFLHKYNLWMDKIYWWEEYYYHRIYPRKGFLKNGVIGLLKFLGLKTIAKKIYSVFKKKRSWPQ